ncbi:MAG: GTP 3',8-cyclase MoaA [Euryarchaeota archaeon]|nr:GTP 3',8-cyclase MoaA [Euryarchaeota archaeon]
MQEYPPLIDSYNRRITSLRISVTQRCNLNCIYCHHEGEVVHAHAHSEIARDTITTLVRAALAHGVEKIKFTGGEPLCRSDFVDIVAELPALREVSVTTNGTLLSKYAYDLAEAGLHRVNISLDTLHPDRYQRITGGSSDALDSVLDGVYAAVDAGLTPVKLNMVLLSGINDDEIWDLIDFARTNQDVILQIIELMDFTGICETVDMGAVEDALRARASEIITRQMHRRRKYMIDGAEVELVRPIDNSVFCANCNRLRVTSDGKLKGCLLSNDNLISISGASEEEMHKLLERSVAMRKPYYSQCVKD